MNKAYTILLGASAMWMLAWGATGVSTAAYAAETDALSGEPLEADPLPEPQQRKETFGPWQRVKITTYGPGYHGKLTNSGERFSDHKLTAAAPVKGKTKAGRHIPSIPFGTLIEVRYGARSVVVKINDTCIGGTLDLSRAAMTELLGRYEETTVRGEWRVVGK